MNCLRLLPRLPHLLGLDWQGIAYLFCENVEFDPVKQVVGYLISLTVGMLPLAWTGQWFEHVYRYIQLCVHCRRYFAFYIFDWISEIEMRC